MKEVVPTHSAEREKLKEVKNPMSFFVPLQGGLKALD